MMGNFIKALETETNIYYVDLQEMDDNSMTRIYDLNMNLLSDNIHATNSLLDDLEKVVNGEIKPVYIHNEVLENAKSYFEEV